MRAIKTRPQNAPPKPPKEPETEKEITDRIHELEYRRLTLPHIQHVQIPMIQERITSEVARLYAKLEELKKKGELNVQRK